MNTLHEPPSWRPWIPVVGGMVLLCVAVVYVLLPTSREVLRTTAPHTPSDVERFGGARSLGQSFIAPADRLAEIRLFLQTPVPRDAFPMLFHLRHGRYATTDVRTVTVTANDIDMEGVVRIRFAPVQKSGGRTYVFLLDAGRAPWKRLTAYRQIDGTIYAQGQFFSGNTTQAGIGDLEFAAIVREPRIHGFWHAHLRPFLDQLQGRVHTPTEQRYSATPRFSRALGVGCLAMIAVLALLSVLRRTGTPRISTVLALLVVAHMLLHAPFLLRYPGVNDEGSYLMDIQNIRAGYWPFRDTLTKGPLFLVLLAPVALFFSHTLLPARMMVAGVSGIEVLLLYMLGRRFGGQTVGLLAAALWALSPVTVAQTSQLFLQPFSLPLVTLALLLAFPHSASPAPQGTQRAPTHARTALGAGILLALAYLVRASSLAFVPPVLLLVVTQQDMRAGMRRALMVLAGMAGTFLLVGLPALALLGYDRTAVLFNVEAFIIGHARSGGESAAAAFTLLPPWEILERFNAHGAVLFRLGMPLVLLWLAAIARTLTTFLRLPDRLSVIGFLGFSLPILRLVYAANFTLAGELANFGPSFKVLMTVLTLLIVVLLWSSPSRSRLSRRHAGRTLILLLGTWVSLAVLYMFFGRFRQQYHAEFLPLYVTGGALFLAETLPIINGDSIRGLVQTWWRSGTGVLCGVVVAAALFLSF
ncbi:MAG: Uncharacterized protein G01um1014106_596, partial [Parcubacteria group bacterium Gr01-1014_106]